MTDPRSCEVGPTQPPPSDLDQALREVDAVREQLDSLRQELAWSNRLTSLGTLSAVLAHEYNNLLTPIGSYAQLALAHPDDEQLTRKALEAAVHGVTQAQSLAEATLGFARPEATQERDDCEIREAIDQALICVGGALKHDGVQVEIDVPAARIAMRPITIQQVLVNLMQNACKAMSGLYGVRKLALNGRIEQGSLQLDVRDTGPGIPNEIFKRLFDPFVTYSNRDDTPPGTGLGLGVCKDLVESSGGTIQVASGPSESAVFRLVLPMTGH